MQRGFGLQNVYGMPKPVYRSFELLHALGDRLYAVQGAHDTVNVWVCRGKDFVTVLITNYAMPRHEVSTQSVHVALSGAPAPLSAQVSRIDEDHVNPRRVWQEMGEPGYLSPRQVETLQAASALSPQAHALHVEKGRIAFDISKPPQSVASVRIEFAPAPFA